MNFESKYSRVGQKKLNLGNGSLGRDTTIFKIYVHDRNILTNAFKSLHMNKCPVCGFVSCL